MCAEGSSSVFKIQLIEHEAVVAGGTRASAWSIRDGARWVAAVNWPGAKRVRCDSVPGMVWEHVVHLELPIGAELLKTERLPETQRPRDPLAYLEGKARGSPTRVVRQRFRVGPRGELRPQ